jgi:DNA-binding Lrp family transcriptional regulator
MMVKETETSARIRNFTPLMDDLVKELGLVTAAVWGRVWRYAQQENGVCQASHETIASELDLSTRTVIRKLQDLTAAGYLNDLTPTLRNRPHTYRITQKARLMITIEGVTESHTKTKIGVSESHSTVTLSHSTMTESQSGYDTESHEETNKKQFKKQVKKDSQPIESAGQRLFLDSFGSKRFANSIQAQAVLDLENTHGIDKLREGVNWAATQGMKMGQAVNALKSALPKWGKPKNGNGTKDPHHLKAIPPPVPAWTLEERAKMEGRSVDSYPTLDL